MFPSKKLIITNTPVKKINVTGNERISKDTIIIFGEINLNEDFSEQKLNKILKNLFKLTPALPTGL